MEVFLESAVGANAILLATVVLLRTVGTVANPLEIMLHQNVGFRNERNMNGKLGLQAPAED